MEILSPEKWFLNTFMDILPSLYLKLPFLLWLSCCEWHQWLVNCIKISFVLIALQWRTSYCLVDKVGEPPFEYGLSFCRTTKDKGTTLPPISVDRSLINFEYHSFLFLSDSNGTGEASLDFVLNWSIIFYLIIALCRAVSDWWINMTSFKLIMIVSTEIW